MSERYTYICQIFPHRDTEHDVMELWWDGEVNAHFAIEAEFLDQVEEFHNPYTGELTTLPIPE
jgi:hypothetical protein